MTTERFFVSYSGVKLPLNLVNELHGDELDNRNTYFLGIYDAEGRLSRCEKRVYGEVELLHQYQYHLNGVLSQAEITDADGDVTVLQFDDNGRPINSD